LAAAIVPFVIVATVNATTITGGEDFRGIVNFLFTPLGLILLLFSTIQFVDFDHRRLWGAIVTLFCALEGFLVLAFFGSSLIFSYYASFSYTVQFLLFFAAPLVGFAGGIWGVFWKRSWQKTAVTPGIAEASRKILVGGSILLVLELPILLITGYWEWVFAIPALLVLACGVLLYRTRWNKQLLGVLAISLSAVAGYPFYGYVIQPGFDVYTVWAIIVLLGIVLSITGALQTIRKKQSTTATRDSNTPI